VLIRLRRRDSHGSFNDTADVDRSPGFSPPAPSVEPTSRRIRVRAGGTLIAESDRAQLLVWFGPGRLPTYCLPPEDVRAELMRPTEEQSAGFLVDHDIVVGGGVVRAAARLFRDSPPPLSDLDGYWTFTWDDGVQWYEEAMEVHVHARDPHKRVDAVPSDRHVRVEIEGVTVAESSHPLALFETHLPTRWYLPREDVRLELLTESDRTTRCPYKGTATCWSAQIGDNPERHRDIAWSYPDPIPECPRIAGLIAFFNERVELYLDSVLQERPRTPWSPADR
jgi:uncharacterized protein (DUF427 family)